MYIKSNIKKLSLMFIIAAAFAACKKDKNDAEPEIPEDPTTEYKYVRVLVSDELSSKIISLNLLRGK